MRSSLILVAQAFAVGCNAFQFIHTPSHMSLSNVFSPISVPISSLFGNSMIPPFITKTLLMQAGVPPRHVPFDNAFSGSSISRIVRIPCDGCNFPDAMGISNHTATDIVLDFTIPSSNSSVMTLNGQNAIPSKPSGGHQLIVGQIPQEVDSIVYLMRRDKFPTVPVNHSRIIREETNSITGAKKFVITISIASVNHTDVSLKGLEMTVFQDPPRNIFPLDNIFGEETLPGDLHFGPYASIPKGESCGLDIRCIMAKIFHEAPTVPAPWTPGKMPSCGDDGVMESPEMEEDDSHLPPLSSIPLSSIPIHPQIPLSEPKQTVLRRIVRQILLPVFVGIAVGMAVSLFGLIVGHIFVAIWRRISGRRSSRFNRTRGARWFRRFRRDRSGRDVSATNMADGEVEKALLPESEAPPAYADEEDEDIDAVEKE